MIVYEPFKNIPLSNFHEELQFEFPDLPVQLFDYYLISAAIEMARAGNLIRRRAIIKAEHGVTRYLLESPDGNEIQSILGIRSAPDCGCGSYNTPRSFSPPEGAYSCGQEIAWYDDQGKVLHVQPPYCHGYYFVALSIVPSRKTCELPEKYYTDFLPTLLMGTRAGMLLITGKAWTNLQLGNAYMQEFQKMIRTNSIDTATHRQRGSIKMKFGRVL